MSALPALSIIALVAAAPPRQHTRHGSHSGHNTHTLAPRISPRGAATIHTTRQHKALLINQFVATVGGSGIGGPVTGGRCAIGDDRGEVT